LFLYLSKLEIPKGLEILLSPDKSPKDVNPSSREEHELNAQKP
jgi:hypothetical protein